MDPITAVRCASSILTFVDFGLKIVKGTLEVVKLGTLVDNSNITIIVNDFHAVVSSLGRDPLGTSANKLALKELATKCQQVSQKLTKILENLQTFVNISIWQGVKITLRSMGKKGEVANLESQLQKYRSEIMTRLLLIFNERQLSIQLLLSGLQSQVQDRSTDATTQLQCLRHGILEKVEQKCSEPLRLVREMKATLDTLLENRNGSPSEIRIMKRVFFPSLCMRKEGMRSADVDTFEWIFRESIEKSAEESAKRVSGKVHRSIRRGCWKESGSGHSAATMAPEQ